MALKPLSAIRPSRSTIDLATFLAGFPDVVDESDGWVVTCPAHADGAPSLRVAVNEARALLLHCRAGCSKDSVLDALNLTRADLFDVEVGTIAHHTAPSQPLSADSLTPLSIYLTNAVEALTERGEAALDYAAARFGVTPSVASALGLGFDDGTVPHPGLGLSQSAYLADHRLVVPFRDFDGTPIGLQARALTKHPSVRWSGPVNPKDGGAWSKYGVFRGESGLPGVETLLTEGPGDAITTAAAGYDAVCIRGASLGSNVELADRLAENLTGRRVIVAGDADAAGTRFITSICEALSSRGVNTHRLVIPASFSDITEWREADPASFASRFASAVQSAAPYGQDQILADQLRVEGTQLLTDVFNARALVDYIRTTGADIRYTTATGFMLYPGHHVGTWVRDDKEATKTRGYAQAATNFIQRRVLDRIHSIERRELAITDDDIRKVTRDAIWKLRKKVTSGSLITRAMSSTGLSAMLQELKALDGIAMEYVDFDADPNVLAVANGVVNLESGALTAYDDTTKDLYITRKVHYPYRPNARNPRWERFVADIFQDHDGVADYVQRLLGYGITGHGSDSAIGIFYGNGANGKGTLTETVEHVMSEYTVSPPFSFFERKMGGDGGEGPSPALASIAGARLVLSAEGQPGKPMAEGRLKQLTGGGKIQARYLHQHVFEFRPSCLIILESNHRPEIKGQDHGIWRRLKLVPFTRKFEGAAMDGMLKYKFRGDYVPASAWLPGDDMGDGLEGILAWLIEGAMEWYRVGLQEPAVITDATLEYKETSDDIRSFITDKLVEGANVEIKGTDLFKLYLDWATEENLPQNEVLTRSKLYAKMREHGAVDRMLHGSAHFNGFRARTSRDTAPV